MTTEPTATTALKRAAKKYERADAARKAAMAELTEAIRAADRAGIPRNEIQRLSGVSRVTLYRLVEGPKDEVSGA